MISRTTVLVLGAGASKPYGLPLGRELRDDVIRANRDFDTLAKLSRIALSKDEYFAFTDELAKSGCGSVDAFLERREERWMGTGKAAIALCLLWAERKARQKLFPPFQPKDHWYEVLWSHLKAPSWHAFKKNPLHVVTFNYDRSLEHYLVQVLCNNYNLKQSTVCSQLPIIHVHGSLGDYDSYPYGSNVTADSHEIATNSIRIVHESDKRNEAMLKAREVIANAERVLFLGFGYHEQNMKKIGTEKFDHLDTNRRILGTHKGIKARPWERLCHKHGFWPWAPKHGAGDISEFIRDWME